MSVHLLGTRIGFDYEDERFHLTLPARLSPIIGRYGRLRCRLDAVRRSDHSLVTFCSEAFEAELDSKRGLVLPRDLPNRRGLSIDSRIDITLEARLGANRWLFWRRTSMEAIHPGDDLTIDLSDEVPAAPVGDPRADAASQQAHLSALQPRAAAEMAVIQAAIDAPARDQELRRMRMALARADHDAPSEPTTTVAPEEARAQLRRQQEIPALYRTVRDSRLAAGEGTSSGATASGDSRSGRSMRSGQRAGG
jgi:hypothetical protein